MKVADLMNVQFTRWAAGHRDADLLAQIAPEMLRHLQKQGVARSFWVFALIAPVIFFFDRFVAPSLLQDYRPMSDLHYVVQPFLFLFLFLALLKHSAHHQVDREIRFRRKHGKWRWER